MAATRSGVNRLKMMKHKMGLEEAMREVHKDIPSTVIKAKVKGKKKEAMLRAIGFSKAGMSKKKK